MTPITLKSYQQAALDALTAFARAARVKGAARGFAELAGRPVVSLAHPGGLRTSYEPVRAAVRVGQPVTARTVIGSLEAGHAGCRASGAGGACLHWGAMWGPASGAHYVDPLGLVKSTPIRLKPLHE